MTKDQPAPEKEGRAPTATEAPDGPAADGLLPDPEEMRRLGYRAIDHLVKRWTDLETDRPWQGATRVEAAARLDGPAPEGPGDPEAAMERAVREIFPLTARIDHPRFFAFVPSAPVWPAVLGDILVAGHNVFQGTWLASSGPSQVELTVLEWFRRWLGMPEGAGGILTSGGSVANLLAVAVAREAAGWPEEPVVFVSDQGHSSLARAARVAGLRPRQIRVLPTDEDYRLQAGTVRQALEEDRAAGRTPILVCANGGATNTGVADPLRPLAEVCRERGVRLHVDAAYGGFAVLDPRGAEALDGLGEADSVTLDPHKWLFQNFECGCLVVRESRDLEAAFRVSAEYLQDTETSKGEVNFGDRGVQLTRAFRALKIWLSVHSLGTDAIAAAIGRAMELARKAEARIRASDELELLHPAHLGVVCYRFRPAGVDDAETLERLNERIQERIVRGGHAMVSSTRLRGTYALRLCILSHRTRWSHVEGLLQRVEEEGRALASEAGGRG